MQAAGAALSAVAQAADKDPDLENWDCPICYDLLYKPCVNTACGHVFCFWCFHHSMNGFAKSMCPLCRAPYSHFPKVCTQLHYFLQSRFPEAYERRHRENQEYEHKRKVQSPDIPPLSEIQEAATPLPTPSTPNTVVMASQGPTEALQPLSSTPEGCSPSPDVVQMPEDGLIQSAGEGGVGEAESATPVEQHSQGCNSDTSTGGLTPPPTGARQAGELDSRAAVQGGAASAPALESAGRPTAGPAAVAGDVAAGTLFQPYALAGLSLQDFACRNPACGGRLAHEPAVLSCGHLVCYTTCRPDAGAVGGLGARAGTSGASSLENPCSSGESGSQGTSGARGPQGQGQVCCPHCLLPVLSGAGRCGKLDEAIQYLFPAERDLRTEAARQDQAAAAAAAAATAETAPADAVATHALSGAATGSGAGSERPRPRSKIPNLDVRLATCTSRAAAWRLAWQEMAAHADMAYTWFAIGCDCCGVFPIQGRRYRCRDCPDSIGFDLCGPCHDLGWSGGRGRFNQVHTADHRVLKVEPEFLLKYASTQQRQQQPGRRAREGAGRAAEGAGVGQGPAGAAGQEQLEATRSQQRQEQEADSQGASVSEGRPEGDRDSTAVQHTAATTTAATATAEAAPTVTTAQTAAPVTEQPMASLPAAATAASADTREEAAEASTAPEAASGHAQGAGGGGDAVGGGPEPDMPDLFDLDEAAERSEWVDRQSQAVMAVVNVLEALHPELRVEDAMRLAWMEWGAASLEQLVAAEGEGDEGEDEEGDDAEGGVGEDEYDEDGFEEDEGLGGLGGGEGEEMVWFTEEQDGDAMERGGDAGNQGTLQGVGEEGQQEQAVQQEDRAGGAGDAAVGEDRVAMRAGAGEESMTGVTRYREDREHRQRGPCAIQ